MGAKQAFYLDLGIIFKEDEASKPLMLSINLLKQHTETRIVLAVKSLAVIKNGYF